MSAKLSASQWLDAAVDATRETAIASLGSAEVEVSGTHREVPVGLMGAYVPLMADDQSLHIGLVSSDEGCATMARALLGMEPDDEEEELREDDMVDAVAEVVNILAGVMMRRMADRVSSFDLGLPIFVSGKVSCPGPHDVRVAVLDIDGVVAQVVMMQGGAKLQGGV